MKLAPMLALVVLLAAAAVGVCAANAATTMPSLTRSRATAETQQAVESALDASIARRQIRCSARTRVKQVCAVRWTSGLRRTTGTVTITRSGLPTSPIDRYRIAVVERGPYSATRRMAIAGRIVVDPRRAVLGQPLQLLGINAATDLIVTPGPLTDPYVSPTYPDGEPIDTPADGTRFVTVQMNVHNVAHHAYEDSLGNGARLVTNDDHTIRTTDVSGCDGSVNIPAGETRIGCVAFEVPFGVVLRQFEYQADSGFGQETGAWKLSG